MLFNFQTMNFNCESQIKANQNNVKIKLQSEKFYFFDVPINPFAMFPDMAFLHCDFVQPNLVGNSSSPILKSFPIKRHNVDNYVTFSVTHPEFFPVSKYDLSFVKFELKDIVGNLLPFQNNKSNVIVTIFIRNRNKYLMH